MASFFTLGLFVSFCILFKNLSSPFYPFFASSDPLDYLLDVSFRSKTAIIDVLCELPKALKNLFANFNRVGRNEKNGMGGGCVLMNLKKIENYKNVKVSLNLNLIINTWTPIQGRKTSLGALGLRWPV